ncbi:ATPase, P-type cation-transporter [Hyaloraphidium curvatum]|nr:ATPase, P-type cation-transporter [Hyaloraphidium curvatum]
MPPWIPRLTPSPPQKRLAEYGDNELFGNTGPSAIKILLSNIFNAMNVVLSIAMIMSFVVYDYPVAVSLIIVMIINIYVGYIQEYRGEKTMEALKSMSSPTARVLRHRDVEHIPTREVVPGDIVYLEEGDICPADLRLLSSVNLELDEASLTGESLPVSKNAELVLDADIPVGDRKNMAFMNCAVTKGRGHGVVVGTGLVTEIGKIASSLSASKADKGPPPGRNRVAWFLEGLLGWHEKTQLQVQLEKMMYWLLVVAALFGVLVFAVNGFAFSSSMLLYAVSVGVALIPEGLPAVVVVTMAAGVKRMARQKAIVRRLNALEALGRVTDICSDKTGTLTEGKMVSTRFWVRGTDYIVSGKGLLPEGVIMEREGDRTLTKEDVKDDDAMYKLMLVCKTCITSTLFKDDDGVWKSIGDPTEVALDVLARKGLVEDDPFVKELTFLGEHPFDPTLKRMTVVYLHAPSGTVYFFYKGALERVLEISSSFVSESGDVREMHADVAADADDKMQEMAGDALRVLALGYRVEKLPDAADTSKPEELMKAAGWAEREAAERGATFLGLVGMFDPPRRETKPAVVICREAGIRVRMATGDHPKTAEAIAKQVEIIEPGEPGLVMPAAQFDKLDAAAVDAMPELPDVLARCSPMTKVTLVEALHRRDRFVVMTGDGSNDAPAIKQADVGIAMGMGGSEVTKQVAAIVLTDDNFETIVNAVAQGRRIFANISKFIVHLLSSNVAEVIALVAGLAFKDRFGNAIFPLSPIQILWINMFTSSPIALALGIEKADPDIMLRPPRLKHEGLFSKEVLFDTFVYGIVMGIATLGTFVGVLYSMILPQETGDCNKGYTEPSCTPVFKARGAAFVNLTFFLLIHGINCRDFRRSIFKMRLLENKALLYIILVAFVLTTVTIYIPWLNVSVFMQEPLTWELGMIAGCQLVFLALSELYKLSKRRMAFWNPDVKEDGYRPGEGEEFRRELTTEGFVKYRTRVWGLGYPLRILSRISVASRNSQDQGLPPPRPPPFVPATINIDDNDSLAGSERNPTFSPSIRFQDELPDAGSGRMPTFTQSIRFVEDV